MARKSFKNQENIISENGKLEIFTESGTFPAETGGLESLRKLKLVTLGTNGSGTVARVR